MAQTAVEWLEKICQDRGYFLMSEYFEQAKEMEKEHIMDAWDKRVFRGTFVKGWHIEQKNGEEYYKETYGGKDL